MAEVQHVVSGFNIGGLDPIEVAKPVTGSSITLADTDIGSMNVFSGSANTTVTLPSVAGLYGGYSKAGRAIGFRGRHDMTARVTLQLAGGEVFATQGNPGTISLMANHIIVLFADPVNSRWVILDHRWPPKTGYFSAYRSTNAPLSVGNNTLVYNTIDAGNADGWYNSTTGIFSPTLPGSYRFHISMLIQSISNNTPVFARIAKNGSPAFEIGRITIATATHLATFAGAITLEANGTSDSFQPTANVNPASTLVGDAVASRWQVEYLGQ